MTGRVSSPRFVGRREELQVLVCALERAQRGEGSVTLIGAEAGMGKSRLIGELAGLARLRGATVLVGECLPLGDGELPFAPILAAVRALINERGPDAVAGLTGPSLEELGRLLPELAAAEAAPPSEGARSRLFDALLAMLVRAAREAPVVFVVEDLHWSDPSTRDFLTFLVRGARREPLALIVSYRSDELHRLHPAREFLVELQRSGQAARLEVRPLTREEVREQVGAIRDVVPDLRFVDRLLRRAEGNPFFTEELLASSSAEGDSLPDSLRDALLIRVERCTANAQQVLRAVAVAGREVDLELLTAAGELSPDELAAALREGVDSYVLTPGPTGYSFRHALSREAVYADLLPDERRALHLRLAHTLAERPQQTRADGPRAAELAHHYHAAGALGPALAASIDAAIAAERAYAFGEALSQYSRALQLWDAAADDGGELPVDRLTVLQRSSEAAYLSGSTDRAIELARATLACLGDGEPIALALAHERLGRYLWTAGHGEDALPEYRRAVELMPARPPGRERAQVLAAEAQALMLCGYNVESRAECAEALEIARSVDARRVEANVLNTMIGNFSLAGETDSALQAMKDALAIAQELGVPDEIGRSYVNGSDSLDQAGRPRESIDLAREGLDVCARFGADEYVGNYLRGEIAGRLLRIGAWDEAEALLDDLLDRGPRGTNAGIAYGHVAWLHTHRGGHDTAALALERAEAVVGRAGGSMWAGPLGEAATANALWAGEPVRALEIVHERLHQLADLEYIFFTVRLYELGARACADLAARTPGDQGAQRECEATAAALLERLNGAIERLPGTPQPRVLASRQTCAAEHSRVVGGSNASAWAAAESAWSVCEEPYNVAYARWRKAEAILVSGGDPREAELSARAAYLTSRALGAQPLLEELGALARRARLMLTDERGSGERANAALECLDLTPREIEVLALLGRGMTNREIGAELFISDRTASVHVSRILDKLSVPNRAAAAAAAQHLGLDPPSTASFSASRRS